MENKFDNEIILNLVREVFNSISEQPICINLDSKKTDVSEWGSLFHLHLIVELEEKFDVEFTTQEIEKLDAVNQIIEKIKSKI